MRFISIRAYIIRYSNKVLFLFEVGNQSSKQNEERLPLSRWTWWRNARPEQQRHRHGSRAKSTLALWCLTGKAPRRRRPFDSRSRFGSPTQSGSGSGSGSGFLISMSSQRPMKMGDDPLNISKLWMLASFRQILSCRWWISMNWFHFVLFRTQVQLAQRRTCCKVLLVSQSDIGLH